MGFPGLAWQIWEILRDGLSSGWAVARRSGWQRRCHLVGQDRVAQDSKEGVARGVRTKLRGMTGKPAGLRDCRQGRLRRAGRAPVGRPPLSFSPL